MRQAPREVVNFDEFAADKKLRYAIERQLMIIGEATSRVSPEFRARHPEIPSSSIVGQRNVLAHEYGEVLIERVWRVAAQRLPELLEALDPLIPALPKEEE